MLACRTLAYLREVLLLLLLEEAMRDVAQVDDGGLGRLRSSRGRAFVHQREVSHANESEPRTRGSRAEMENRKFCSDVIPPTSLC